ncbi:MAG: pyridoxine 5'-phosphate synthase [Hyphomicrobiales bacterium]|nr:pyridoxine 5'-phosphate synthase [Hyphomicrobiales bacterium]
MPVSPPPSRVRLGINVDHVATLRNARGGMRPDPVRAALAAIEAGADGITAHLREDRRHITDTDMARLKAEISKPLNFEMAATQEMLEIALRTKPHAVCLVPEKRSERTTEGGLDVVGGHNHLVPYVGKLAERGIRVSLFIEPGERAIEVAARLRVPVVELHTGAWCEAVLTQDRAGDAKGFAQLQRGAKLAQAAGLEVHAGHGLDFDTARRLAAVPEFVEFNIGHFLMGEALFSGLGAAIREIRKAMDEGRSFR